MGNNKRKEAREGQERQRRARPHRVRLEFQAAGGRAAFEMGVRYGRGAVELWLGPAEFARLQPVE